MDLSNAMQRGQLELFYQPQLSSGGNLHGMEALLRWKHPVAGYIAPPVLIALAYEGGFLHELSRYLLNLACRDAVSLEPHIKNDLYLSINISSKQMEENSFFDKSLDIIQRYKLEHVHLVLEITERSAMIISDTLMRDMSRLKDSGISFSLDDFGMGHNSILYLQERIFDEVKLDGKLVSQLPGNERSKDILSGIISMAQSLDLRIVAEFVETEEQRDMLLELGCTIYQGYYYSRPLCYTDLTAFLNSLP